MDVFPFIATVAFCASLKAAYKKRWNMRPCMSLKLGVSRTKSILKISTLHCQSERRTRLNTL